MRKEQLGVAMRLVERFPDHAMAICFLGLVHEEQRNTARAVECWEKSLKLDPNRSDAYDGIGRVAWLNGESEKAAAMFRKGLEINPRIPGVRFRLAEALIGLGRIKEAVPVLEEGIEVFSGTSQSYRLLGEAYLQLKEYEKAKENYQAALQLQPEYTDVYYGLATACARLGEKNQAREYRERFRELIGKDQKTRRDQASQSASLLGTRQSVAYTHTEAGRLYRLRGYLWEAEKLWRRAATLDPKNRVCRVELASLYQQTNREPEALQMSEPGTEIVPEN